MRIISGIKPTGVPHIGNYLGAIKQQIELQDKFDNPFYFVADLHAITVPYNQKDLKEQTLKIVALYLALGLNPNKSTLFLQSHLPQHSELNWLLTTQTTMGELGRMTQFKEKGRGAEKDSVGAGLFNYPTLMAADILLYQTTMVPVGEDQIQHIELTRDLAKRFNKKFGETFKVPKAQLVEGTKRIMSLNDPSKKMSKTDLSPNSYISLDDNSDDIAGKIKRAVTDSGSSIEYSAERTGLKNLIDIYAGVSSSSPDQIVKNFEGKGFAEFKQSLADTVIDFMKSFQPQYFDLLKNEDYLLEVLTKGAKRAEPVASETLTKAKQAMGFI